MSGGDEASEFARAFHAQLVDLAGALPGSIGVSVIGMGAASQMRSAGINVRDDSSGKTMRSEPPARPFVSVIIPTFNEAGALAATIASARSSFIEEEIIVVDGGSTDGTPRIAANAGCRVIEAAPRRRATQMNLGASAAQGDVFLFLHADTRLQHGALLAVREALRDPRVVGGAFVRRYDSPSRILAATCQLAALRNRWLGWHLGDQAMFVRQHIFRRCGPFAEIECFEDLDFSRRLARCGRIVTLRPPVISSARRFAAHGPFLTTVHDFLLTCRYAARGLGPKISNVPGPTGGQPIEDTRRIATV